MRSKNKSHNRKSGPASQKLTRAQRTHEEQIRFQARRARQRGDLEASKALLASLVITPVSPARALWKEAAATQENVLRVLEDFASASQTLPADDVPDGLLEALDGLWSSLTRHPRREGAPMSLVAACNAAVHTLAVFAKQLEALKDFDGACAPAWESVAEFQDLLATYRDVITQAPRVRATLEDLKHAS